jgi:hypothetical protein
LTESPEYPEFPSHWSEEAVDTAQTVLRAQQDLEGPGLASLCQACELISTASSLDEVARREDYVTISPKGVTALHPAVVGSRQARAAASMILHRLTPVPSNGSYSDRQRGASRARWSTRPGVSA